MSEHTAAIKQRFTKEFEWLWSEDARIVYRRLARRSPRELMKLLDSTIDFLISRFINAPRILKKQLSAEGVSVWLSAGCLVELAGMATVAAARTRRADEPYAACLRREIKTRSRFIREWTGSDRKFDEPQWGELVAVARKYALPRAWKFSASVPSVRDRPIAAQLATREVEREPDDLTGASSLATLHAEGV